MNKSKSRWIAIVVALGLVTGCKVGQQYVRPDLSLPDEFRGDTINGVVDTAHTGTIQWSAFFQDPILKELIDSALVHNNDMKTALLNLEIANRQLRQNRANYLPAIDATIGSANRQWRSSEFNSGPSTKWYNAEQKDAPKDMFMYVSQFGSEISFSWELDIWGKISNRQDQLLAEYLDTFEAKNAVQTSLIANVAKGYFNLLMLDAKIEVAKRNVRLNDSTLRMIELQYDAGEITALAIQQTESQRLLATSLVPQLEREIFVQENALRVLAGQMPDSILREASFTQAFAENMTFTLATPVDVIRNRPDVRSAEFQLIAANANANIQQAMRYPSLNIGGSLGINAMLPKNWFNIPGALLGGIAGDITTPIFRNKTLKTRYEIARLERDKMEIDLQQTVVEAVNEVSNAVVTIEKQREELEYARRRVENSQLAVRNATLLFKSGYASYLEVITAQSSALSSDLDLVELRQQHLQSHVDLYRALGGGWK